MIPQVLTNMNMFVDGRSFHNKVKELVLPVLKRKLETNRMGGMDAEIDMPIGLEKLECNFTIKGFSPELLRFFGLASDLPFSGNFRGAFKDEDGTVHAVIVTARGLLSEVDMGTWTPGDGAQKKFSLALRAYKLEYDGRVLIDIDVTAPRRVINGVDELAAERAAIGL